ncbi:MAG: hemin uptake protein HemP [Proteobacteria bacterium]|nr:hemin uptake protein HemP [Pseudomonadota bacterium]
MGINPKNRSVERRADKEPIPDGGWVLNITECVCGRPRISSKELFPAGHSEICVEHEGLEYCLRITKQKKLILYR